MTSALLTDLLKSLGLLGGFLLIGTFLRAKVSIFQKTFLPASVIGGFLLLILGPVCLNILPIPQSWLSVYSLIPGILIVPVVASVPLGLKFSSNKKVLKNVIPVAFIMIAVSIMQFAVGFGTHILFKNIGGYDLYDTFGWEMGLGFSGGHGTAGLLGNMLHDANLPYWETAQGVATTAATFGIVGGIIMGMILINWAARKGYTSILKKPGQLPETFRIGYERDVNKQVSIGKETTSSASIDTFAFHSAIILTVCGISYFILDTIKGAGIPVLKDISIWAYSIIVMFIVWGIMCKLKIDYLVDSKVKSRISGSLTEFAVIAAIASLPIKAVAAYIIPIIVMVALGFVFTIGILMILCKKFLKDYWFEHMIAALGMSTGVFLTGMLLLRVCDPEMESPVLGNYTLGYTITSVTYFALLNVFLTLLLNQGIVISALTALFIALVFGVGAVITSHAFFGKEFCGN